VQIIKHKSGSDPAAVAFDACEAAVARNVDILVLDTAGRLHTKKDLMQQLTKIRDVVKRKIPDAPHEVLLVLDATTGQNAISQAKLFTEAISDAKVVFANGPMGFFEKKQFTSGTTAILRAMTECDCTTVVGGGHLGAMAESMDLADAITHISTGGGAAMDFMTGKKLPVMEALEAAAKRMD